MSDHHHKMLGLDGRCGFDHMAEQAASGNFMENLGRRRLHASSLACRKNDHNWGTHIASLVCWDITGRTIEKWS
jgi:hypothetical protein